MTKEQILMMYHGELNEICKTKKNFRERFVPIDNLTRDYRCKLRAMLNGKSMTIEEYRWISDRIIMLQYEANTKGKVF